MGSRERERKNGGGGREGDKEKCYIDKVERLLKVTIFAGTNV